MYFKITKCLLQSYSKEHIISSFSLAADFKKKPKRQLIDEVIEEHSSHPEAGPMTPWLIICPFCRAEGKLLTPVTRKGKPTFCVSCGKTSPLHTLETSLQNTDALLTLASKMNLKAERNVKSVLTGENGVRGKWGQENGVKSTVDPCSKLIRVKSRLDPLTPT